MILCLYKNIFLGYVKNIYSKDGRVCILPSKYISKSGEVIYAADFCEDETDSHPGFCNVKDDNGGTERVVCAKQKRKIFE